MKLARKSTALVALVFTLLCAALAPASAPGRVLCVAADGHVSFEAALGGDCCSDAAPVLNSREAARCADASLEDEHCGPCVDIPLVAAADQIRSRETQRAQAGERATATALLIPARTALEFAALSASAPLQHPANLGTLRAIKTVTLLI